jgi:hypothetical protein
VKIELDRALDIAALTLVGIAAIEGPTVLGRVLLGAAAVAFATGLALWRRRNARWRP